MNTNLLSYSQALIELANNDHKILDEFYNQLIKLQDILNSSKEFTDFINNYTNNKTQRKNFTASVLKEIGFDQVVIYWTWIIIDNNLTISLSNIIQDFIKRYDEINKNTKATIYTAKPLTIEQIDSISKKITSITKQKTTFKSVVDKKYIGGIKLEIGTKVFDNTISTKLETIINALKAKGDINV